MGTQNFEKMPIYSVIRGEMNSDKNATWEYDKIFYRTVFSVDYPITLVGLGFFGPAEGRDYVKYEVEYEISYSCKPDYYYFWIFRKRNVPDPVLAKGKVNIVAKVDEKFFVDMDPVSVPANINIDIAFCFKGPKTRIMKEPTRSSSFLISTLERDVHFQFSRGSLQMPEILFGMAEEVQGQVINTGGTNNADCKKAKL